MRTESFERNYTGELDIEALNSFLNEEYETLVDISEGRLDAVQERVKNNAGLERSKFTSAMGNITGNPLRDAKYYHSALCGMICRVCVSKGMDRELAFRMHDYYVDTMERTSDLESAIEIVEKMILDFTGEMSDINRLKCKSKVVSESIGYITAHIYEPLTLNSVAKAIGLSPSYLSRQFTKETGTSISNYIRDCKLEKAGILLRNTDLGYAEISNMLAFSSQSHFIRKFKDYYGTTPQKYRKFGGGGAKECQETKKDGLPTGNYCSMLLRIDEE